MSLLLGTFASHLLRRHLQPLLGYHAALWAGIGAHLVFDVLSTTLLIMLFALIYYFAPDIQHKRWRWFTPGSAIGILGWFLSSVALRLYLHFFNTFSLTYGSLGAVIILLTWFYITGLMLLLGAEINSEIEAAATEVLMKARGVLPEHATTDPEARVEVAG
jgi:membrane protein